MNPKGEPDGLHGYYFEDLEVGMEAEYSRTITDKDISAFAELSGDNNPLHLNHEFASKTVFEGRIAHGLLSASFISTVIGTKLPGPGCIYLTQKLKFLAPVRSGDRVSARATILELMPEKKRARLETVCVVGDTVVIEGDALIIVPTRP